jgi:tetratricopeptide (TPR) repeat protein
MRAHKSKDSYSDDISQHIVTSDAVAKRSRRRLKIVPHLSKRAGLILLAIVLLGIGGYVALSMNQAAKKPTSVVSPRQTVNALSSRLERAGNSAQALKSVQNQLAQLESEAESKTDKETYALASANLYRQANQLDNALQKAEGAKTTYQSAISAATLAEVYRAQGDYANAAKYYGIASARSPKTAPNERSAYNDYRLMKAEMETKL